MITRDICGSVPKEWCLSHLPNSHFAQMYIYYFLGLRDDADPPRDMSSICLVSFGWDRSFSSEILHLHYKIGMLELAIVLARFTSCC